MLSNSTIYDIGGYRTRKFCQIWPDIDTFITDYDEFNNGIFPNTLQTQSVNTLYCLLYAYYGESHIASRNEYQFKLQLFSIMFMYGPTWEKELTIQSDIRQMDIEEIRKGGKAIYNTALNPAQKVEKTGEGTNTLEELTYINQQNTTNYKKSLPEAYAILESLLQRDVTKEFINQFKKLFYYGVIPDEALYYEYNEATLIGDSATGNSDGIFDISNSAQTAELVSQINQLTIQVNELQASNLSLLSEIDQKNSEITQQNQTISSLESEVSSLESINESLQSDITNLQPYEKYAKGAPADVLSMGALDAINALTPWYTYGQEHITGFASDSGNYGG